MVSILQASTYEHYQLYKDIHTMKMGGANIGLGGSGRSVFYNPAGLSTMKRKDGAEIRLINLSISTNENVLNIGKDGLGIQDIEDEDEKNLEAISLAEKYLGKNNHFELSDFTYIAKGVKNFNFSLGALANVNLDFRTHRGFGTDGIVDIQSLVLGGAVFGLSYNWSNSLSLGVGVKYLEYGSIQEQFTIGKFISHKDDLDRYLTDESLKSGESIVFDLGGLYKFRNGFQIGFSSLNIGGIGKVSHLTYIPETHNIGLGYIKKFDKKFLTEIRTGFDYTDITENYIESDAMKKIKTGVEASFVDNTLVTIKSGVGLYQGYYTVGLSLRLAIIELSFTTYAEEIGAYSGQDEDRRYLINLTIGW